MIDPKELRIGNYIRFNEKFPDDPELELNNEGPMNEDDFNFMLIDNGDFRKNAEYIPLTEEWLKWFGFELVEESKFKNVINMPYYAKDAVILFFNRPNVESAFMICMGDFISNWRGGGDYVVGSRRWIYHVHTLQNFYHAATGNELTLKS
jgi:hypothetical protein